MQQKKIEDPDIYQYWEGSYKGLQTQIILLQMGVELPEDQADYHNCFVLIESKRGKFRYNTIVSNQLISNFDNWKTYIQKQAFKKMKNTPQNPTIRPGSKPVSRSSTDFQRTILQILSIGILLVAFYEVTNNMVLKYAVLENPEAWDEQKIKMASVLGAIISTSILVLTYRNKKEPEQ